jgi:hypothetical protein
MVRGWDADNEKVINQMRFRHNYCHLIRTVIVFDTIQRSRDIYYNENLTGVRQ